MNPRMIQIGTETRVYVASHLEAVGGEAEVVVEDGEEDNDDDEPEDDADGTVGELAGRAGPGVMQTVHGQRHLSTFQFIKMKTVLRIRIPVDPHYFEKPNPDPHPNQS